MTGTNPIFPAAVNVGNCTFNSPNALRNSAGNVALLFTAGPNGSIVSKVRAHATGNTTNGLLMLFLFTGNSGFIMEELPVLVTTPSGTVAAWDGQFTTITPAEPFPLASGQTLKIATQNAETFAAIAQGGDF